MGSRGRRTAVTDPAATAQQTYPRAARRPRRRHRVVSVRYLRDRLAQALLDAKIDGHSTADIGEVVDALLPVVRNEVREEKAGATRLYIRYRDARDEVTAERDALAAKLGDVEALAAEFAPQGKPAPQLSGWDVSRRIRAILRDQP